MKEKQIVFTESGGDEKCEHDWITEETRVNKAKKETLSKGRCVRCNRTYTCQKPYILNLKGGKK